MRRLLTLPYIILAVAILIFFGASAFFLSERNTGTRNEAGSAATSTVTVGSAAATPSGGVASRAAALPSSSATTASGGATATRGGSAVATAVASRTVGVVGAGGGTPSTVANAIVPTVVFVSPTATPLPPTPTAIPPTAIPPTATAIPPTVPPPPPPTATPIPPTPVPPPLAIRPLGTDGLAYGFNVFLAGNSGGAGFNTRTMGKVREAGFGWVRVQLQWSEFEPSPGNYNTAVYDTIIGAASNGGANVLVSVVKAPAWASPSHPGALPENTAAFGRTMRYLAARYSGTVGAWEIWNEQNLAGEVGGRVAVAPYFETLKAGYGAVKAVDPHAIVLFGGLTPTGLNDPAVAVNDVAYLREFYAYRGGEGRNYFDVLAAHPGSAANPPDTTFPENPGSGACPPKYAAQAGNCWKNGPDFYFRRVEDQRAVMVEVGDAPKQVWLTEFGWDSCQGGLPAPNGYEYCALTSEAQQAQYILRAFAIARAEWPWMGAMFLWNLNYAATPSIQPSDEKYAWSVLRGDWSNRPAFEAIKAMPK